MKPDKRNPASCVNSDGASTRTGPGKQTETESRPLPNVIQLPRVEVGIEPGRHHGWNIVARRRGRIVLHDRCVADLSVAECEAAELAQLRGWRLAR